MATSPHRSERIFELTLVVPGLLPVLAGDFRGSGRLARLLARGRCHRALDRDPDRLLFRLCGVEPGEAPPVAPVSLLGEGEDPGGAYWLRADPVQLEADQAQVFLLGNRHLALDAGESRRLAAELDAHLREEGCALRAPHPRRWYLRLPEPADLRTHPPAAALGHAIHDFQPEGADRARWQRVATELQMLLHASPVSAGRTARGLPGPNSLWLWGGGTLPPSRPSRWDGIRGGGPLLHGLARLTGTPWAGTPGSAAEWLAQTGDGRHLVVLDGVGDAAQYGDRSAWVPAVEALLRDWLEPIVAALSADGPSRLWLLPGAGQRLELTRRLLWRWWRRPRALETWR